MVVESLLAINATGYILLVLLIPSDTIFVRNHAFRDSITLDFSLIHIFL